MYERATIIMCAGHMGNKCARVKYLLYACVCVCKMYLNVLPISFSLVCGWQACVPYFFFYPFASENL